MSKRAQAALEYHAYHGTPKKGYIPNINRMGFSTPKGKNFYGDADLLQEISDHTCTRCNSGYDPDIRWLRIGFFYELNELSTKLRRTDSGLYIAPYCKACRGDFLSGVLRPWMEERVTRDEWGEIIDAPDLSSERLNSKGAS